MDIKEYTNEIYEITKNKKVIAFDFWDTLVHRKCRNDRIIVFWAKALIQILNIPINVGKLIKLRKEAEIRCKELYHCEECTYEQLLGYILKKLKIDIEFEEFKKISTDIEIYYEKDNLYIDEVSKELFARLQKENKKIIIISDFYFGVDLLQILINYVGYEINKEDIFISSDYGCRKDTGSLYNVVVDKLSISKDEMIMIGDCLKSDYAIPNSIGIAAYHKHFEKKRENYISKKYLLKKIITETVKPQYNLSGYVNLLLLIVERLYRKLRSEQVKNVFFCSREGQVLKKIFDKYQEFLPQQYRIKTHYLYVSRKATLIASLRKADVENFESIFGNGKEYSVEEFLGYIGFEKKIIDNLLTECDINPKDIIGHGELNKEIWNRLLVNRTFCEQYDGIRLSQRELFNKYLDQFGVDFTKENFYMVDVGWRGTIQDNIRNFMPASVKIVGYYLGIYDVEKNITKTIITNNSKKIGIMFSSAPTVSGDYYICRKNRMFWEVLFSADHGPVIGYKKADHDEIVPVIDENEQYMNVYDKIKNDLEILLEIYEKYMEIYNSSFCLISDNNKIHLAMYAWQMFVNYPENYKYFLEIQQTVVDNYIKDVKNMNNKKTKLSILEKIKVRIIYYFNYNCNYLNLFYYKKNFLINKVGKFFCILVWVGIVFSRILMGGIHEKRR